MLSLVHIISFNSLSKMQKKPWKCTSAVQNSSAALWQQNSQACSETPSLEQTALTNSKDSQDQGRWRLRCIWRNTWKANTLGRHCWNSALKATENLWEVSFQNKIWKVWSRCKQRQRESFNAWNIDRRVLLHLWEQEVTSKVVSIPTS